MSQRFTSTTPVTGPTDRPRPNVAPIRPRAESPPRAEHAQAEDVFERWGSNHPGIDFDDNDGTLSPGVPSSLRTLSPVPSECAILPAERCDNVPETEGSERKQRSCLIAVWGWLARCCGAAG